MLNLKYLLIMKTSFCLCGDCNFDSYFLKMGIFLEIYQGYTTKEEQLKIVEILKEQKELDALHISGSYFDDPLDDFIREEAHGTETKHPSWDMLTVNLSYSGDNELIHDIIKRYNDYLNK